MLNKISINYRIVSLIALPTLIFLIIGYLSFSNVSSNVKSINIVDADLTMILAATDATDAINEQYTMLLTQYNSGFLFYWSGEKRTAEAITIIKNKFDTLNSALTEAGIEKSEIQALSAKQQNFLTSYKNLAEIFVHKIEKAALNDYTRSKMLPNANGIITSIDRFKLEGYSDGHEKSAAAITSAKLALNITLLSIIAGIISIVFLGYIIMRSITRPAKKLTHVVHRLSEGEFDVRAEVQGSDEFSELGTALNTLLNDRSISLAKTEKEHKELNQSVFKLLQTVAELSERNLTIRASVTEDATGPVADALNLLAEETTNTLIQVRDIAAEVNETSQKVNTHLISVNKLAMREQEQAIQTAEQMDDMMIRLDDIANSAAETNNMADTTIASTNKAHDSVSETLTGMSEIRDTVQETGKRIKQLGERSQEISHVIDIINTIAERTTVLALNASMQAAAAGDEGRGFSVIAEEIQRLSESSRESTSQISTLVRNIQQETNTTIATMDKTIEQVIDGSTKAEDAALQMKEVLETTSQLVESVDKIAQVSREQVGISEGLKHKAQSILKSTQSTGQELLSLTGLSRNMGDYAQQLVHSVNVFKLEDNNEKNIAKSEADA